MMRRGTGWVPAGLFLALAGLGAAPPPGAGPKVRVVLIDGQNNHDWRATTPVLKDALERTGGFAVGVASDLAPGDKPGRVATVPFPPDLGKYDVLLSNYNGAPWPRTFRKDLEARVRAGRLGLVIVHAADNAFPGWPALNAMIGLGWRDHPF